MATRKKKNAKPAMIRIQYYRSAIGLNARQGLVVRGLGFRRLNAVREVQDSPAVRGMVAKIPHLVRIVG
jgi:large subunit ribosomal protein L30